MTRRRRKPKLLPLPKAMPPRPVPAVDWCMRWERERDEADEQLRNFVSVEERQRKEIRK